MPSGFGGAAEEGKSMCKAVDKVPVVLLENNKKGIRRK